MKKRPNIAVEEDTEEMKRWRSLFQSEMDRCWKNLAERIEEEVLDKNKGERAREGPSKVEETPRNGEEYAETRRDIKLESVEKTAGQEFSPCLEKTTCSVCKTNKRSQQKRRR